jgi:hypothetical protein
MTRKGEVACADLKRKSTRHVALPADKVRGLANSEAVYSLAATDAFCQRFVESACQPRGR